MGEKPKGNKLMFYAGIAFILVAALLLLGDFIEDSTYPVVLGTIGVIFIGASRFRLLK